MKERILERLQKIRESGTDSLAAMEFAAERSVEMMQAYCNREELPEKLDGVGVALAGMLLENGQMAGRAKSIKEGDISVTFAEGTEAEEELLDCFRAELQQYRKVSW